MPTLSKSLLLAATFSTMTLLSGCAVTAIQQHTTTTTTQTPSVNLTVTPGTSLTLAASQTVQLAATNAGVPEAMTWSLYSNDPNVGSVTISGLFTAPATVSAKALTVVNGASLAHPEAKVSVQIALTNPTPSAAAVSPASAAANTPYVATITGSGFTPGSVVLVNGSSVTSTVLSSTTIHFATGQIAANPTPLNVQVVNALPGGGTSAAIAVPIVAGGMSYDAAARFLRQASWGPTPDSIAHVQQVGFSTYIDEQIALPVDSLVIDDNFLHVYEDLWNNGLYKPSQLRQKMMWTWFKVFNIPSSTLLAWASALPELLQRDAFVNFNKLLLDTSLNTSNAAALSNVGNGAGPNPNQNFGRELMQLFSIGPAVLNLDGSPVLDSNGTPVPTYTQQDVMEAARTVTGWSASPDYSTDTEGTTPMSALWASAHDQGEKTIMGHTIPAGGDALTDMKAIVSLMANQNNTAAFMSLRLIHSLVTSNPTPAYVSRITAVWVDDGTGTRGNVAAVVKAILLDPEARGGDDALAVLDPAEGRAMDAIEWQMSVNRVLATGGIIAGYSWDQACQMNQCPLDAPSVFGYYSPSYTLPGSSVLAPELSLFTTPVLQAKATYMANVISPSADMGITVDWTPWTDLATGDGSDLINHINHICLHGTMSPGLKAVLIQAFAEVPQDNKNSQAKRLLYLTFMSPEFAVNR